MTPRQSDEILEQFNSADIQKAISFNNQYKVEKLEQALRIYADADSALKQAGMAVSEIFAELQKKVVAYSQETIARAEKIYAANRSRYNYAAVRDAISSQESIDVINYLIHVKGCVVKGGSRMAGSSVYRWYALSHALEKTPDRIDLLELFEALHSAGAELNDENEDNLWRGAIRKCDFRVLDWMTQFEGYDAEHMIKCTVEKARFDLMSPANRTNYFLQLFEHYMAEWLVAANLSQALAYGKKLYSEASADEVTSKYFSLLMSALKFSCLTPAYDQIFKHFLDLEPVAASREHIRLLIDKHLFENARVYCQSAIKDDLETADEARITLATLLLDNKIDLDEKNSPLDLYDNKQALQALYLLQGCREDVPDQLLERCHAKLSPEKTWMDEALQFYQAYIVYKNTPNNALSRELIKRISGEQKTDQMKGSKRTGLHTHGKFSSKHAKSSDASVNTEQTRKRNLS
jgi:hypothetical protein